MNNLEKIYINEHNKYATFITTVALSEKFKIVALMINRKIKNGIKICRTPSFSLEIEFLLDIKYFENILLDNEILKFKLNGLKGNNCTIILEENKTIDLQF